MKKNLFLAALILAAPAATLAKRSPNTTVEARPNLLGLVDCNDCSVRNASPDKLIENQFDPMGYNTKTAKTNTPTKTGPAVE